MKSRMLLEESRVEKERFQELVDKLQYEQEAEQTFASEMQAFAEAQREAMNEAKAREEELEEQLRQIAEQVLAADTEQNLQVPKLKELLRTALEQEAALLKQVREMQLELALKTPATGQEERVSEHQEQISSLQTQLQEMQQMLHQVKQQHQVEVLI